MTEKSLPDCREPRQNAHLYSNSRPTVRLHLVKAYPRDTYTDIAALRQLGSFRRQLAEHQVGYGRLFGRRHLLDCAGSDS
jgi:hypothetical protein